MDISSTVWHKNDTIYVTCQRGPTDIFNSYGEGILLYGTGATKWLWTQDELNSLTPGSGYDLISDGIVTLIDVTIPTEDTYQYKFVVNSSFTMPSEPVYLAIFGSWWELLPVGEGGMYTWVEVLVSVIETTKITLVSSSPVSVFIPSPLVPDRPITYNPDLGWDEANSVWTPTARGGGRYRQQLIAVGKDGEIYYGGA